MALARWLRPARSGITRIGWLHRDQACGTLERSEQPRESPVTNNPARGDFDPVPSVSRTAQLSVSSTLPSVADAAALAVPVAEGGTPPADLGLSADQLAVAGFTGRPSQTLVVPGVDGRALVAIGIGDASTVDLTRVRDLAADFARAVPQHQTLAIESPIEISRCLQAISPRWSLKACSWRGGGSSSAKVVRRPALTSLTVSHRTTWIDEAGWRRSGCRDRARASSAVIWRTARRPHCQRCGWGRWPSNSAPAAGLEVEVFDEQQLIEMGCGGMLGVNLGSVDEPRLIRLSYRPRSPTGHLGLVGKGIMYDSGGISLKPSDESHAQMKNDMTGAAAMLGGDDRAARHSAVRRPSRPTCVHRQHAVGIGDEARRRPDDAQRNDRRGAEHRRRGPAGDGRRPGAGGRGTGRRDRRHRHPDRRLPAHLRRRDRRRDGQQLASSSTSSGARARPPTSRSGSCRCTGRYRRAARLGDRRPDEHGRRQRRLDHRGAVPRGVRRRPSRGRTSTSPARHSCRRPDLAQQGRDRVRHEAADRARCWASPPPRSRSHGA